MSTNTVTDAEFVTLIIEALAAASLFPTTTVKRPRVRCNIASKRKRLAAVYGDCCFYCNKKMVISVDKDAEPNLSTYATIDHVLPHSLGGSYNVSNLVLSCRKCNNIRGNESFESFLLTCINKFGIEKIKANYLTFLAFQETSADFLALAA